MPRFEAGQKVWITEMDNDPPQYFPATVVSLITQMAGINNCYSCQPDGDNWSHYFYDTADCDIQLMMSEDDFAIMLDAKANEAFNRYCDAEQVKTMYSDRIAWDGLPEACKAGWRAVIKPYLCTAY